MFSRRNLIQSAAALGTLPMISKSNSAFGIGASTPNPSNPHFFLHINLPGGLDKLYTFDSRPLDMTQEKIQVNHLKDAPERLQNNTGGIYYRSSTVKPLLKYFDRFSVINGVMMTPTFDGHSENENELFAGQALGGDFYMPTIAEYAKPTPISFLKMGPGLLLANLSNMSGGVTMNLTSAHNLKKRVETMHQINENNRLGDFLNRSLTPGSNAKGGFEKARLMMKNHMGNSQKLIDAIKGMQLPAAPESAEQQNPFLAQGNMAEDMSLLTSLFKGGLAMSALYTPNTFGDGRTLDTHDQATCAQSEAIITNYVNDLAGVFKTFSETPFDDKQSMLDMTTIMVTTEMSRTMRQEFKVDTFEENGTDHNQLSNTVLIGGKGIKPSMVVGSSDFQSTQEWKSDVSGAHLEKDKEKLKTMGRPFDFATFKERADRPEKFVSSDYLTINSVVNTVYEVMGTPKEQWRKEGRSDDHYPTLGGFLTS